MTGWVRERRQERGVERLVVDTFAVDDIGTEILRSNHTFRVGPERTPERLGRRPVRTSPASGGQLLPSVQFSVTEESIDSFEAAHRALVGDPGVSRGSQLGSSHTGAGLASDMGLAATIASQELGLAYLHELVDRRFGIDFRQGGKLTVNYRRPVYAGDTLTAKGIISGTEEVGGRTLWRVQVWLENGRGEMPVSGEAQVMVPSPLT